MRALLPVALFLAVGTPAHALETWMWGVGPRIGTQVLPGRYPAQLPKDKGGEAATGPRADEGLSRVQHDLLLGAEGVYYMDRHHRIGFTGGAGFGLAMGAGRRFTRWDMILTYDYAVQGKALDVLFGGGIGAGTMGFRGEQDQTLRVNTFPLRGEVTGLARDKTRGYQLTLFAQYDIPSRTIWRPADGSEPEVGGGVWFTSGIEIAVPFGDFDPPKANASPVRRVPPSGPSSEDAAPPADDPAPEAL